MLSNTETELKKNIAYKKSESNMQNVAFCEKKLKIKKEGITILVNL